ncbi:hypothetical protein V2J09_004142, partial [Rumex salicifolius]
LSPSLNQASTGNREVLLVRGFIVYIDPRLPPIFGKSMADTRAQAMLRETVMREVEEVMTNRFSIAESQLKETLDARFDVQANQIKSFNDDVTSQLAGFSKEILEAMESLTNRASSSQPGGNLSSQVNIPQRVSPTEPLGPPIFQNPERVRERQGFGQPNQVLSDDIKVTLASIHLEDKAACWHQSIVASEEANGIPLTWPNYRLLLLERFGEVVDDPIADLMRLRETEGIVVYHEKFESIRNRVLLSESYLVSAYLAGLRVDTQMHLRMFRPQSIRQCFTLGKLYEMAHPKSSNNHPPRSFFKAQDSFKKESTPATTDLTKVHEVSKSGRKFLTQAEMNERRAKGLCYQCDEPYTPDHYLKHKKTQLYLMEAEENEDEIQISVNAVAGVSTYRTMRVKGLCGQRALFILIDSGSTHNFLDAKIAGKLGCHLITDNTTQVSVADGSSLAVSAKIKGFQWSFNQSTFTTDMMVIPLGCCDMVLGVQWLETLGKILWDFKQLTMEFKFGGKKFILRGISPGSVREIQAREMNRTLFQEGQISMIYVREHSPGPDCFLTAVSLKDIVTALSSNASAKKHYTWIHSQLRRKGKLLDPNANKRNWAKFARFCINLDCSKTINREIVIPDENGVLKKYILWFEDVPQGCGNCVWQTARKNGKAKAIAPSSNTISKLGINSGEFGGIAVLYKTDESSSDTHEAPKSASGEICPTTTEAPDVKINTPTAEKSEEDVYSPIIENKAAIHSPGPISTLFPPENPNEEPMEEQENPMEMEAINGEYNILARRKIKSKGNSQILRANNCLLAGCGLTMWTSKMVK